MTPVEHSLKFVTEFDETTIKQMCKEATLHALGMSNVLPLANENNTWAEVTIAEGN